MAIDGNHRNSSAVERGTKPMQGSNTLGEGIPFSDRPHTISSAYEKSGSQHQRPLLQPYTFNPPESTLTIPETCELSSSVNDQPLVANNQQIQQESTRSQKPTYTGQQLQRRSLGGSHDSLPPPPPPPKPPKIVTSQLHSRPG